MAGIGVPGLGRKLRLLIDYGHFKNWNDLGNAFECSGKTVQWWGHGDDDRSSSTIPGKHFETLIDILKTCLPHGTSRAEVLGLIPAPSAELELLLQAQAQVSLNRIIEAEADTQSGSLFLKPKAGVELIETDQKPPVPKPDLTVSLNDRFRLEFNVDLKSGYFSSMQHAGKNWGPVRVHFDKKRGVILLPGFKPDGELAHMWESRDAVINRFIVMQTPEPSPPEFRRYLEDELALDGSVIGRIAHFYSAQPKQRRRIFVLTLDIKE